MERPFKRIYSFTAEKLGLNLFVSMPLSSPVILVNNKFHRMAFTFIEFNRLKSNESEILKRRCKDFKTNRLKILKK